MSMNKLPPANANAERAVIGAALRDPDIIPDVCEVIGPESFSLDAHQRVWRVIVDATADGRPVDLVSVHDRLKAAGWAGDVGGPAYLAELFGAAPSGANALHHAGIVREAATLRAMIHAANEILRDAYDHVAPAAELLSQAERRLFDIADRDTPGRLVSAADMAREALDRIDARAARRVEGGTDGITTGFADLDNYTGGLRAGQLVVLGARPGGGKTALALNVAAQVASTGAGVLVFSMEMPHEEIADRLLSMGSNVPASRIGRGDLRPQDIDALTRPGGDGGLRDLKLWVDDTPCQSGDRLLSVSRRAVRRLGVRFIVVDYLQLMKPANARENRTQQVGESCRRVWQMARECGVPVLLLCQLNREVDARTDPRPKLSDLRESGEIEQHAHKVLMLYPHDPDPGREVWQIGCVIAKNRNGPVGEITLDYRRPVLRFADHGPQD